MFKVLLVNPPRVNLVRTRIGKNINIDLTEISSFPPIGLMYLAQALKMRCPEFQIKIIDAIMEKITSAEISRRAAEFMPDVIGITAHTYNFFDVLETASCLKSILPHVPIVIGGSHMYIFAEETMTHKSFDYGVRGDGENVFSDLCTSIAGGKIPFLQPGLFMRSGSEVIGSGTAILDDLDSMTYPAIDLIDATRYYNTIGKQKAVGTICTSRGCPFHCTFCQVPKVPYRMRSVQNVIEEIREYQKIGIDDFFIFDDLFNINKERVRDFCNEIIRTNLKIGFMFRGRIDQLDNDTLKIARKAGCHTISMGIEDATDQGLKAIKKNIKIQQAFDVIRLIRKNGIRSSTNWIIGFPHHKTMDDLNNLFKASIKADSDYAQFGVLHCLPGSEIYEQAVSEKGIDPEAWRNYVLNPTHDFELPIWEKHFTKRELFDFYEYCYKKYYIRPKLILRELIYTTSLSALKHKIEGFVTVFLFKGSRMKTKGSLVKKKDAFRCNLCGSEEYKDAFIAPAMHLSKAQLKDLLHYAYVECSGCGLTSQFPVTSHDSIDRLYEPGSYHELEGYLGRAIEKTMRLYYFLVRRIPKGYGKKLLDIGAGSGKFLYYAVSRGWQVLGTEQSIEAAKLALDSRGIKIIPQREMAGLQPEAFDLVTVFHVLEHVDDPTLLMEQIYSLISPRGSCIVQIPVLDSLDFHIWRGKSVWVGAPQHKNMFTSKTFQRLASKCGFKVCRIANDWISPQLLSWSMFYEFERRSGVYIPMEIKKLLSLILLPIHLPLAGAAAIFNNSPFKTYYLEKAGS